MKHLQTCLIVASVMLGTAAARAVPLSLVQEKTLQVTSVRAKSQTTRSSGRCLCLDGRGNAHMTWEDARNSGQFDVYYTSTSGDTLLPEIRLTRTQGESSYPAISCRGDDVFIVWEETIDKDSEIFYVHLRDRTEVARLRLTDTNLDSSCPACAAGRDGVVHVAWHEGPYKQTGVYYAKIVDDSLVSTVPICTQHPEAFRPDIACDDAGHVLIIWYEGMSVKSRFWDGKVWGDEQLVAALQSRPWRLSVTSLTDGTWAAAWFDRADGDEKVFVGFFDGATWHDSTLVSAGRSGYYPNIASLSGGGLVIGWEEILPLEDLRTISIRTYDGKNWGRPMEIYRNHANGRYVSVANAGDAVHALWFSGKSGSNEIYYSTLRKR